MTSNGKGKSTELLAKALKGVFEEAVAPLRGDIDDLRGDMNKLRGDMNKSFDTTNKNTQAQIAEARKGFSADLKKGLSKIK